MALTYPGHIVSLTHFSDPLFTCSSFVLTDDTTFLSPTIHCYFARSLDIPLTDTIPSPPAGRVVDPTSKRGKKKPPQVRRKRWIRTVIETTPDEQEGKSSTLGKSRVSSRNNQQHENITTADKETKTTEEKKGKIKEVSADNTATSSSSATAAATAAAKSKGGVLTKTSNVTGTGTGTGTGVNAVAKTRAKAAAMVDHHNVDMDLEEGDGDGTGAGGVDVADFEVDSDQGRDDDSTHTPS